MPLFEFTCRKCNHTFEELMSQADLSAGDLQCPECGSTRVERGFSSFATASASGVSAGLPCGAPAGGGCGSGGFT
jgi:putative FmdB family regulatory protein